MGDHLCECGSGIANYACDCERRAEVSRWLMEKKGWVDPPTPAQVYAAWDDFELDEAYEQALSKND